MLKGAWLDQVSFARKGGFLLLPPLIFQTLLVGFLVYFHQSVEASRTAALTAADLGRGLRILESQVNRTFYTSIAQAVMEPRQETVEAEDSEEPVDQALDIIEKIAANDPELLSKLRAMREELVNLLELVHRVNDSPANSMVTGGFAQHLRVVMSEVLPKKQKFDEDVSALHAQQTLARERRRDEVTAWLSSFQFFVLVGYLVSLLVTLYLLWCFNHRITRRIGAVTDNLQRLEKGKELHRPQGGQDEIAQVDRAIHALSAALSANAAELDVFLYSVSHDLRSPLINLKGLTEELQVGIAQIRAALQSIEPSPPAVISSMKRIDKDFKRNFTFVDASVTRLAKIIDALLRLSRAGKVTYRNEAVDLSGVLTRVVSALQKSIDLRSAKVMVGQLPSVFGDETALEQIFANVLGNAVTYLDSDRAGEISVFAEALTDRPYFVKIVVRDNGVGMTREAAKKLFLGFHRFRPDLSPTGEGVGLSIVRRILVSMGGWITCSTQEGVGTDFLLFLPLTANQRINLSGRET